MDISKKIPSVQLPPYVKQSGKAAEKQAAGPAAKGDQVEISAKARELQAAREAIAKMDDVDHGKVARIKARIESGAYKVDADKTAGKMLEDSLLKELE